MKRWTLVSLVGFFLLAGNLWAETFQVEHKHFRGSCQGSLTFGDTMVEYVADRKEHSRSWKYEDIQQLEIVPGRISVLTYNARKMALGADQRFDFKLLSGTLSDQFRIEIAKKLSRPLVSGIVPEKMDVRFSIPARHKGFMSNSQGILEFGEQSVVFRSSKPEDSRIWRYDELLSLGSTGPFQLRLGALQKTGGGFGAEKNYVFDLKRRMTSEEYDFIWDKINRIW